jgi:hypothetical protein
MIFSPVSIILQVIDEFISLGHKGCIYRIKLSHTTVEISKQNSCSTDFYADYSCFKQYILNFAYSGPSH